MKIKRALVTLFGMGAILGFASQASAATTRSAPINGLVGWWSFE